MISLEFVRIPFALFFSWFHLGPMSFSYFWLCFTQLEATGSNKVSKMGCSPFFPGYGFCWWFYMETKNEHHHCRGPLKNTDTPKINQINSGNSWNHQDRVVCSGSSQGKYRGNQGLPCPACTHAKTRSTCNGPS